MSKEQKTDRFVETSWEFFLREFPMVANSIAPEALERYKSAWKCGFYFAIHPKLKETTLEIQRFVEQEQKAAGQPL